MKILVTGGAGFIGSHIADLLIENNHDVIIIDNLSSGKTENINKKAVFYHEDLTNHDKIREIFVKESPEIVYHLAAQIDIRKSVENPVFDANVNILSALNLLELSIKSKVKHFIFSSTGGAIYGDTENIPTTEEEKELPISPYGCAKLTIEKYLNYYNKVHNLKYTVLRYSNVYGPRQNSKGEAGVIAIFLDSMLSNDPNNPPKIFGGEQTRDFVYVKDVAIANLKALNKGNEENEKESNNNTSNTYNIGTGIETSINQLFNMLNQFFNSSFQPIIEPRKQGEQMRSCLSYNKANQSLGWKPETKLDEGIKQTYEWFKAQK